MKDQIKLFEEKRVRIVGMKLLKSGILLLTM